MLFSKSCDHAHKITGEYMDLPHLPQKTSRKMAFFFKVITPEQQSQNMENIKKKIKISKARHQTQK